MARPGYSHTRREHDPLDRDRIANSAWEIGMKRDLQHRPKNKPGKTWVADFIGRHDDALKELVSRKMGAKRTQACSREAIGRFFRNEVDHMMGEHKFKPQNMWNFDETMLEYKTRKRRVVVSGRPKKPSQPCQTSSKIT